MRFAIATIITVIGDYNQVKMAMEIASDAKKYSLASRIVITPSNTNDLTNVFNKVIVGTWRDMVSLERDYDKILYVPLMSKIYSGIDSLFNSNTPSQGKNDVFLLRPDLMASKIMPGFKGSKLSDFYEFCGYKINTLYIPTNILKSASSYTEWEKLPNAVTKVVSKNGLRKKLEYLIGSTLGEKGLEILDKEYNLYSQCFTHKDIDALNNYELLEAYGDRLLAGQFVWIMVGTPGIISPDQVTKISSFFQDNMYLEDICDQYELGQFIQIPYNIPLNSKIKGDIIESLIGAVGISWDRSGGGQGNSGTRKFVNALYKGKTIDPVNYLDLYESPIIRLKNQVESYRLDRDLLTDTPPKLINGYYEVSVLYNGNVLATARLKNLGTKDRVEKLVRQEAYREALKSNALTKYINN